MADPLCGPSNALQSLQKHGAVDRTLQQDRLASRPPPAQGFRSSPGPNAGLLDPEFEAFQAGQNALPHPDAQQFHPASVLGSQAPQQLNQPKSISWATDFQRLNVSNPATQHLNVSNPTPQYPQPSYTQQAQQSQPRQLGNGWHHEFIKQQNQAAGPATSNYFPGYNGVPFQRLNNIGSMAPPQVPAYPMSASQGQVGQPRTQAAETFDEEAFARAFDQAALVERAKEQAAQKKSVGVDQDVLRKEGKEKSLAANKVQETQRIGADLIHDPRGGEGEQGQHEQGGDSDALAQTAGDILDRVKDDQSDKFKNSQFLQLMRQLRDHEVTVKGDKFVGVAQSKEHSQGGGQSKEYRQGNGQSKENSQGGGSNDEVEVATTP